MSVFLSFVPFQILKWTKQQGETASTPNRGEYGHHRRRRNRKFAIAGCYSPTRAGAQLTRSLPLSRPHGFAHLCHGLIRLRPQAHPFGSPHLCRTASRWLHSQLAPLYLGCSRRARPLPRGLTGHVAHPIRSIRRQRTTSSLHSPNRRLIRSLSAFSLAKEDQVNENA